MLSPRLRQILAEPLNLTPDPTHTTATCFLWIDPPNAEVLDQGLSFLIPDP